MPIDIATYNYFAQTCLDALVRVFTQSNITGQITPQGIFGPRNLEIAVLLDDTVALKKVLSLEESVALAARVTAVAIFRRQGQIVFQFELPRTLWRVVDYRDLGRYRIGFSNSRAASFSFAEPHTLIAGATNSGKTVALQTILFSVLRAQVSTETLGLIVLDPHRDFKALQNNKFLIAPVAYTIEEQRTTLAWAFQIFQQRWQNRSDTHTQYEAPLKRIVLAVDEIQKVVADEVSLKILQQLAAEARKIRMHLLVATQKPTSAMLPGILNNLTNRYVGRVTDGRVAALLTGQRNVDVIVPPQKLTGSGDFVHISPQIVERLQFAWVPQEAWQAFATQGKFK